MDMDDEERTEGGLFAALRARSGMIIGGLGLIGWLALLWFMFGDVL